MKMTLITLILTLAILMSIALWKGTETFTFGLHSSLQQLLQFFPLLVIAMFIAGFAEILLPRQMIEQWLSDESGWRGIGIAWLAGILTPGGSLISLPLVGALYRAGVGITVLITYATSFATLSILRIPLEVGFYGWRLTGMRMVVSLILPLIAGGLTQLLLPLLKP